MGNSSTPARRIDSYADGAFYNVRASFKVFKLLEIGTHMSLCRLRNGRFLVIDTVPLDEALRAELDELTDGGRLIDAVVATHPFHTLAFPGFREAYPEARFFGTPRHLVVQPTLSWAGDVREHLADWEADGVFMRIPAGAEFVNPQPPDGNHFSAVWVFSQPARFLHVDDTVMYLDNVPLILRWLVQPGAFELHPSVKGPGLYPTADAPRLFQAWLQAVVDDWDFDSVAAAHRDVRVGGAKELMRQLVVRTQPFFDRLVAKNARRQAARGEASAVVADQHQDADEDEDAAKKCAQFNVDGNECG